jgi:uncharacterized oligopeptide transporter (OPT) family protein
LEHERSPRAQRDATATSTAGRTKTTAQSLQPTRDLEPAPLDLTSPQFTLRAVVTGMVLGGLLSTCSIYVGLKLGASFNMSITAALLGYGFWSGLHGLSGHRIRRWGILENNINQTACSAGASVASAGLVAPIPALTLLTGQVLEWHYLALWVFSVMLVGIAVAVPLRRRMLLVDELPFPAGIASAEMLRELHTRGAEALARVKMLVSAGLVGVAMTLCAEFRLLASYGLPFSIKGFTARSLTMTLDPTLLPVGIGGLIGFRACCSLLLGAILAYGVLSPAAVKRGLVQLPESVSQPLEGLPPGVVLSEPEGRVQYNREQKQLEWLGRPMTKAQQGALLSLSADPAYHEAVRKLCMRSQSISGYLRQWLLWPGVTLMVVGSLVPLCFSWRSVLAVLPGWRKRAGNEAGATEVGQVRRAWFALGLAGALLLSVILQVSFFKIHWGVAMAAVLLTFALAVVAARVVGETGVGPVGPMGKVSQVTFGLLVPKNPVPNLMAANVTGGAASQCGDLLDDLKCGYLLGAAPRLQTLAQLCGAGAGALVGSVVYVNLVRDPAAMLLSSEWPMPAVLSWKAVAELFLKGFEALPPGAATAMTVAALVGAALPILTRVAPRWLRPLVPSPVSMGLAFILSAGTTFSLFMGGLMALLLRRWFKDWSARFLVAICVGAIAGESLTGIGLAMRQLLPQ